MNKILIIEDDIDLSNSLKKGLEKKEYIVSSIYSGLDARLYDWSEYDLVLLDWNLPGIEGIDLLRHKRGQGWFGPCIMLTAKSNQIDILNGLDFGADDYITKPFDWNELYSRINSALRRKNGFVRNIINAIEWDNQNHLFYEDSILLDLTETETKLLELFFNNPNKVFNKYDIIERIYNQKNINPDSNVIERHISALRKKFNYDPIKTIHQMGYRLRPQDSSSKN
ncbi:MAG: response regulator transcription factor [Patescibacteria group bacterium]